MALLTGISRRSINDVLKKIRLRIAEYYESQSPFGKGEIEMDESFFGAQRVRVKRGRGALGKHIVFGLIKRGGKVDTRVAKNSSQRDLMPIIKDKVPLNSVIYTDGFKTYDGLVNFGYKKHHRVHHGANEFARGRSHINGIENFWSIAKSRLGKFRGICKATFYLHLKECEFRFNHRKDDLYKLLLRILRRNPI